MSGDLRRIPLSALGLNVGGMRPGEPGYNSKIPPPEPDAFSNASKEIIETLPVVKPKQAQAGSTRRLVISYGPKEGVYVVGIEASPDWDLVGPTFKVNLQELQALLKMASLLELKVKDLTGGGYEQSIYESSDVGDA